MRLKGAELPCAIIRPLKPLSQWWESRLGHDGNQYVVRITLSRCTEPRGDGSQNPVLDFVKVSEQRGMTQPVRANLVALARDNGQQMSEHREEACLLSLR